MGEGRTYASAARYPGAAVSSGALEGVEEMDGVLRLSFRFWELMYESPRVAEDALVWEALATETLEAETGRAD